MSLPEPASQSLAVLSALAVRIRAPSGLNAACQTQTLMSEGGDELARSRIPEFGSFVPACRQDSSTVRTKRRLGGPCPDGSKEAMSGGSAFSR